MTKPKRAKARRKPEQSKPKPKQAKARYVALIEHIFHSKFSDQTNIVRFDRTELVAAAEILKIRLPKNLGDVMYSFRYRAALPLSISSAAPTGYVWVIRPAGRGRYAMMPIPDLPITPTVGLEITKIADSTPGIVAKYSLNDEQALLAKVRYNRLVDLFTGVVCYSLQNHLRTTVADMGQVETDEIYIGVDRFGAHYVFPVQAKGGSDRLNIVQIEQDLALCAQKFPGLNCTALAAQFMTNDSNGAVIALFGFQNREGGATRVLERHYRLVSPEAITRDDLANYAQTIPGALEVLRGPNPSISKSSADEDSV
jgi:hypothetical protein